MEENERGREMERGGGLCKHGSALMLLIEWKWSVSIFLSSHSLFLSVSFSSQSFPNAAYPCSPFFSKLCIILKHNSSTYINKHNYKNIQLMNNAQEETALESTECCIFYIAWWCMGCKGWRWPSSGTWKQLQQLFYSASQHHGSQFAFQKTSWKLFSGRVLYHCQCLI